MIARHVGFDAVRQPDDLDEQRRRRIDREPGVDVGLDRLQAQLIHHLDRRRHHAGSDDAAHGRGAVLDGVEVHQQRPHRGRVLGELDAHGGRDPEHPLAPDERAAKVEPARLGILAAQHGERAVGKHDLDGEHVRGGDTLGQAVRTARVVGDVASDRARLLAARIGGEVQPEVLELAGEVEVEHTGLHPCLAIHRIDTDHRVHLRRGDHHRAVERHRPAGQAGTGTTRHERHPVTRGDAHTRLHLGRGGGQADDGRRPLHVGRVTPVQRELGGTVAHPVWIERLSQVVDERSSRHRLRFMTITRAESTGRPSTYS